MSETEERHVCCACFTHNSLPCCNAGHVDWTGAQRLRRAWSTSPLLRSVRALREAPPAPAGDSGGERG